MRTEIHLLFLRAIFTLAPLPALAGHLEEPRHARGIVLERSFIGVVVYDAETEFRVGENWYRVQVAGGTAERIFTIGSTLLAVAAAAAVFRLVRRRRLQSDAFPNPTGSA